MVIRSASQRPWLGNIRPYGGLSGNGGAAANAAPVASNVLISGAVILQQLNTELTSEIAVTGGGFPSDSTIPQSSEGVLLASQSITPTNANNLIRVEAHICGKVSTGSTPALAIFSDQQTDTYGIQFCESQDAANMRSGGTVVAEFVAGTTSAITVSLRAAVNNGTWTVNKDTTTNFGGVMTSLFSVEEIQV